MKNGVDARRAATRNFHECGCDRFETFAPAFAPVTGNEKARNAPFPRRLRRQPGLDGQKRVDPAVAGHVDLARNLLVAQVARRELGRREQQVGLGVDRGAILLLGPGQAWVMRSKPCFDMGHADAGSEACERSTETARRIALDDEQVGRRAKQRKKRRGDVPHVGVRILLPGTVEEEPAIIVKREVAGIDRLLPGENQRRVDAPRPERGCHG
ncbi:MAG TPA: hypothetical protein VFY95_03725 [Sphingomicrobium sp.]